jgi:hypothetical protein
VSDDEREERYGYVIQRYKCDCDEHRFAGFSRSEYGNWMMHDIGISGVGHFTLAEMRDQHQNFRPDIPPGIQRLIDQIEAWELRALRAEAKLK